MSNAIDNGLSGLNGYGLDAPAKDKSNELGQDDFMQLMLAQMNNQDPFSPMENGEFLAQIAQFNTVSGISELQNSFSSFAASMQSSQALQASTMVGRSVLVPSEIGTLPTDGSLSAMAELPAGTSTGGVDIYDLSGQKIKHIDLGQQPAGRVHFSWDGRDASGNQMPPGTYAFAATANYDGNTVGLNTYTSARVDSVSLGALGSEPVLNLAGLGSLPFSQVQQIM